MTDVVEFWDEDKLVSLVESSFTLTPGSYISIAKTTWKIESVTFALDYSDQPPSFRRLRCNVDVSKVKEKTK